MYPFFRINKYKEVVDMFENNHTTNSGLIPTKKKKEFIKNEHFTRH